MVSDDWLKNNALDDTKGVNKTICKPNEKRFQLMDTHSDSEKGSQNHFW